MQGYTSRQFLPQLRSLDKAQSLQLQPPPQPHQQQPPQPPPHQPPRPPPRQTSQPPQQQPPPPQQPPQQRPSQPPQQPPQPPARQRGTSLIQRLRQQLLRRRQLQVTAPRIRPVEAAGLFRRQPRRQHPRGHTPQPPPGSPTLPTPPPTPPAAPQRPPSTAARKVTLQLATWKLERLDIPPPARTRPPRYCLHPWDLRVRRYTSPRYQRASPPARPQELSSGSEWETPSQKATSRQSEDINGNYWGPEKKTLTQPSLIYRERVTAKCRTTRWTSTQPPLTYKERSPSK
ncbi:PREDICTED: basic salivary proline-rich protein 1-like [Cyphomyrmex costatus]|uniref:basic salivary proline-rich protein 1-like n=1 Tax=Cyphomyrmex costatus TaxID=456900 RepID=UPI00085231C6|nr:PREDICTED: basic salivary proline-rich protein 1-like [Cyphomyrmex costatus]